MQQFVLNAAGTPEFIIQFYGFSANIAPISRTLDPAMQVGVFRQALIHHINAGVPDTGASINNSFLYAVDTSSGSFLLNDSDTFLRVQGMSHMVFYKVS